MSEWEELLENRDYEPVHGALQAGISLLEKYYRRADDTDVYFIAHGMHHYFYQLSIDMLISFGSCFQTWIPQRCLGTKIPGCWDEAV
jgi:hypothetical protein